MIKKIFLIITLFLSVEHVISKTLKENFKETITELSSDNYMGRAASTKYDTMSAAYISKRFAEINFLEPLGDNGLLDAFYDGSRIVEKSALTINGEAIDKNEYKYSPLSVSGAINDQLVYLNYGTELDFKSKDVTDKIAVVNEGLPNVPGNFHAEKISYAIKAKAKGIIIISKNKSELADLNLNMPVIQNKIVVLSVSNKLGNKLIKSGSTVLADVTTGIERKHTFNVAYKINALPVNNPDAEHIIIGAHYDHLGYEEKDGLIGVKSGADDNASGVATIIELARKYSTMKDSLKVDIIFIAFGGEEIGLKGSSSYANNPVIPFDKAKVMVNFDMTGRMNNKGITIRGIGTAKEAIPLFASLPNKDEFEIIWEMRGNGPTDYSSFYAKKVPSFSFSTRSHSDYHKVGDKESKINYDGMEMLFDYVSNLFDKFIFDDMAITYKEDRK